VNRSLAQTCLTTALTAAALSAVAPAALAECAPRPDGPLGYQLTAIHADQVEPPATTPPIAILDSGVAAVPELAGRLRSGVNVVDGSQDTTDADGHGTAVASVAAAAAAGVRGVAPTSPVIPIKILNARGETGAQDVITGIDRAVALGARVINISAAAVAEGAESAADVAVKNAIWRAVTAGALVVAPTGNEGIRTIDIPSRYAHVLAVGATDESNARAYFSNTGSGTDLVAPGVNITAAAPTSVCPSGYQLVTGTSFAAPAVAGAAALLLGLHPQLDPTQVVDILRLRGLTSPAPRWSPELGFGLLDVPTVLAAPVPPGDQPEVDDTIEWAKRHPAVLNSSQRIRTLTGRLAPHTDPADVLRVSLTRGDRLRVSAQAAGARMTVAMSDGRQTLARAARFTQGIPRTGMYYLTVKATGAAPAGITYSLRLLRQPARARSGR
jgi:hypothetical protein